MASVETRNLAEIERLNQRGGRTLTVADLCEAGTLTPEIAAFMLCSVAQGASILTAAQRGGAGKSTLLANILCFLPPGERIITVSSPSIMAKAIDEPPIEPECYLAHEIGSGQWYAYIWGSAVRQFFHLMDTGRRIASCLHADTLEEVEEILTSPPLLVPAEYIHRLGILAFIDFAAADGGRRVTFVYGHAPGGELRLAFRWRQSDDTHDMISAPEFFGLEAARYAEAVELFNGLAAAGVRDLAEQRRRIVEFYSEKGW